MTRKIFKAILFVTITMLVASFTMAIFILYSHYEKKEESQVKNDAIYVAEGIKCSGDEYLNNISDVSERITWIDEDGNVLYDSYLNAEKLENHSDREEVKGVIENGTGESIRYSSTICKKTYNYAIKLDDGTILRLSISNETIYSLIKNVFSPAIIIFIFAIVLSVIFAKIASKNILRPINEIDLNSPKKQEGYEELTPLLDKITKQNNKISLQMEELKNKQREFTAITENMQEGLLIVNNKQEVLSYNSPIIDFFGAGILKRNREVLSINANKRIHKLIDKAFLGKRSEKIIPIGNRSFQIIANPICQDEENLGAVILIFDVTEKEERDKLRKEFTANVSHELKTPLTSIAGFAEIIKAGIVKQDDICHFAENIYNEAQRMISLIGDIIELSKLDEENMTVTDKSERINIYEMTQIIKDRLANKASKRNISIEIMGEDKYINGIRQILEEMIYNLIDNAIKYNKENGKIRISIIENYDNMTFTISDTGIGIPKDECERVFERFYRVDKSHSKEIGGTGLGLSIVKHGASVHGASINIESQLGYGTTVSLQFKK